MTGLLICAAVVAACLAGLLSMLGAVATFIPEPRKSAVLTLFGLALLAVALWLAYAAGGA